MAKRLNVDMQFTADTSKAKAALNELQTAIQKLGYGSISASKGVIDPAKFEQASAAARELAMHLNNAYNMKTGNLDLSKLNSSLKTSGTNLSELTKNFKDAGSTGQEAFVALAKSISMADQPTISVNTHLSTMFTTLKNVARFQISSSIMHGLIGGIQTAQNYAKDLNESLNNIRIVTGASTEQMAKFADQANKAARSLNSTTLDYTNASLIYFQQGIRDESEIAARTETTIKLANVSRQSAETVSDQMTALWNNFYDGSKSLEYYADVITALGATTASSSQEIAGGMEKFASVAKTVGLSYEYAASALATIVAQTRQSEDTVGTGLRTIFARLDSIKLGDTLEDGIDLTKYTNELKKIGVNVLDVNGELKDMDIILDEIGSRWQTLNDTQRTAVANTVGGVRQYSNLIALFDNWDKFQENVQTTISSSGTLQKQADIYAESWEAARDRVKAATEGLYQTLLDDRFFININNALEHVLVGINKFIENLGGVRSLLIGISSFVLSAVADKIGPAVQKVVQDFQILSGGASKVYTSMQKEFTGMAQPYINATQVDGKNTALTSELQGYNAILLAKTKLSAVNDQLSAKEKMQAQLALQGIELQAEAYKQATQDRIDAQEILTQAEEKEIEVQRKNIQARQEALDLAKQERENAQQQLRQTQADENLAQGRILNSINSQKANRLMTGNAVAIAKQNGILTDQDFDLTLDTSILSKIQNYGQQLRQKLFDSIQSQSNSQISLSSTFNNLIGNALKETKDVKIDTANLQEAQQKLELVQNSFSGVINNSKQLKEAFNLATSAKTIADYNRALSNLKTQIKDASISAKDASKILKTLGADPTSVNNYTKAVQDRIKATQALEEAEEKVRVAQAAVDNPEAASNLEQLKKLEEELAKAKEAKAEAAKKVAEAEEAEAEAEAKLNQNVQNFNFEHVVSPIETITKSAALFGQVAMTINSVKGFVKTFMDESATASEKLTASLMMVSMVIPTLISGFKNLSSISNGLINIFNTSSSQILANASALTAENIAATKNIITHNLRIAGLTKEEAALASVVITENAAVFSTDALSTAKGKEEAIELLVTKGLEEDAAATTVASLATDKLAISTAALHAAMGIIAVVILALAAAYFAYSNAITKNTKAYEEQEKALDKAKQSYEDATNKYNELKSAIENYQSAKTALEELNFGTEEWNKTLDQLTTNAKTLMELWPQLASKVKFDEHGVPIISTEDLEQAQQEATKDKLYTGINKITQETKTNQAKIGAEAEKASGWYSAEVEQGARQLRELGLERIMRMYPDKLAELDNQAFQDAWQTGGTKTEFFGKSLRSWLEGLGVDIQKTFGDITDKELGKMGETWERASSNFDGIFNAIQEAEDAQAGEFNSIKLELIDYLNNNNIENPNLIASIIAGKIINEQAQNSDLGAYTESLTTGDNLQHFQQVAESLINDFSIKFQDKATLALNSAASFMGGTQGNYNSNLTRAEATELGRYITQNNSTFGFGSHREANTAVQQAYQEYDKLFGQISSKLPDYIHQFTDGFQLLNTISPEQFRKIGDLFTLFSGKGTDLSAAKDLQELFDNLEKINPGNAGKLADSLSEITDTDWDTITFEDLAKTLGLSTEAAAEFCGPLQKVIDLMKQASALTFEDISTKYKAASDVVDKLTYKGTISSKEYDALAEYEDLIPGLREDFFTRSKTGEYQFLGNPEEFKKLFDAAALQDFQENAAKAAENLNYLSQIIDESSGTIATTFQNLQENGSGQDQLNYLRAAALSGVNGIEGFDIGAVNGLQDRLNTNDPDVLRDISALLEQVGDQSDTILKYYKELLDTKRDWNEALNESPLREFDDDVTNQIEERVKFLQEYGAEMYGLSDAILSNIDALQLIAEEFLRAEAAAKRFNSSIKEWEEAFETGEFGAQIIADLANTYKDLLNLSKSAHLSKEFLKSAENLELMRKAIEGSKEAYDELSKKAIQDILHQGIFDNTDGGFEIPAEIDTSMLENQIMSEISVLQAELDNMDLTVGATIDDTDYIAKLEDMINAAGLTVDQATAILEQMGIDAEVVEGPPENRSDPAQFTYYKPPVYEIREKGMVNDGAGGQHPFSAPEIVQEGSLETETGTQESSTIAAYALHIKSAKKGSTGSGGNISHQKLSGLGGGSGSSKGGGGGKGSGSEKKPRTPKAHAKENASERYHTITQRLDDLKKAQDEAERRKTRAFGAEKIAQLEKEISLRKETLKLQEEYISQINEFLTKDKDNAVAALGDIGLNLELDDQGVITNYQDIQDQLLQMENDLIDEENSYGAMGEDVPDDIELQRRKLEDAKEALKQYEDTLNKLEEQAYSTSTGIDELNDAIFELMTTKIELKLGINEDDAKLIEYYLEKYGDNAYKAAEAIAALGQQTANTLDKIRIYEAGIADLLYSKGLSISDLQNLDDARIQSLIANGDFTQAQVEQIREWRDGILDANKALLEMRNNISDKLLSVLDDFKDRISTQSDLFDHYNNNLSVFKDLTELMGRSVNKEQRKLINDLNNAMLENSKNNLIASKNAFNNLAAQRVEAQRLYDAALAEGGEEAAREYEELLKELDTSINDFEEDYLDSWQSTMDSAQTLFEEMIDSITDEFDQSMSGTFGNLEYLKEAFSRQSDLDDQYLSDYNRLYELNKLQRDLNKVLTDTRGVTNRKELLELQRQINDYQAQGVKLSEYDIKALRAKLELQQAYNDLQLTQDAKQTVRLSRDSEGNWGYVYTANQDEVAKAEQAYEDKLNEYQKLNDNYIKELQDKALEVQTTYKETLQEIMKDVSLTDDERQARINELNDWLATQQSYFSQQSINAIDNQASTLNRLLETYHTSSAILVDSWAETTLAGLTGLTSLTDYMDNWVTTSTKFFNDMVQAFSDHQDELNNILELAGTNILQFSTTVTTATQNITSSSELATTQVINLSDVFQHQFKDALTEAIEWEQNYVNGMADMIAQNEEMIKSLNDLIASLATIRSYNHLHDSLDAYLQASKDYQNNKISKSQFDAISSQFDSDLSNATSLDTGGYTGAWGPEGKLAVLHEKEEIFDAKDTANLLEAATILRQIDISASFMARGLGSMFSPFVEGSNQTIEQEVHIEAHFPDATDHNEIEQAFDNLVNKALQYANRKYD